MVIYKYVVPGSKSFFDLELPLGAEILAFQKQDNTPVIWVLIDEHHPQIETRHFAVRGTSEAMNDWRSSDIYIGTVQISPFVWHLFETKK
ncbi:MAG: hypothetical protein V3W19_16315 [Desulfatiglandales bacterium]